MITQILEAIPLPSVFIGADARILGANAALVGIQPGAGEQRTYIMVFRQPGISSAIESCLRSQQPQSTLYLHNEGAHETRYRVSCSYVTFDGKPGVLSCFQDVSHVEQAGEIRREFVANVSHELKTPLTALLGFIETLRGPAKNDADARDRFLGIMEDEARRMNRLVGDLLSLSRVEEDAKMRPTGSVDVYELLTSVLRTLQELAHKKNHSLNLIGKAEGATVPGDLDQLMQVFTNLIENAIKYGGESGEVTIELQHIDRDPSLRRPALRVNVTDTGPGFEDVHIPRLTERFYRIDSHRSREMGGTGLGLAIVKHIVNRHRGRMRIQSTPGKGSNFSVILPKP